MSKSQQIKELIAHTEQIKTTSLRKGEIEIQVEFMKQKMVDMNNIISEMKRILESGWAPNSS